MVPITSCPGSVRELGCVVGVFESSGYGYCVAFPAQWWIVQAV